MTTAAQGSRTAALVAHAEGLFPTMSHGPVEIDATIDAARVALKESA